MAITPLPAASSGPPSALQEVSWQTCFWIIVTLALNTMVQPCGRTSILNGRHSFYLRSSPLVNIVNTSGFIMRLIYLKLKLHLSFKDSFSVLVETRFADTDGGSLEISKTTWMRWVGFVLGPLPQVFRLAAFQGIFWTKVIGFVFVVDWIVVEVVIFFSIRVHHSERSDRSLGSIGIARPPLMRPEVLNNKMVAIEGITAGFLLLASLLVISIIGTGYILSLNHTYSAAKDIALFVCYLVTCVVLEISLFGLLLSSIETFCGRYSNIGSMLLVATYQNDEYILDENAVFLLVCFSYQFCWCAAGYRFLYDPVGTISPGWSAIWG